MNLPMELIKILSSLEEVGAHTLLVGGCVRDSLLGKEPKDFDVEVYGMTPEEIAAVVAPFGAVNLVGRQFGIVKLRTATEEYDFSVPRRENKIGKGHKGFSVAVDPSMTPYEAALRRDFTMNSLAMNPFTGEIFDFFGGVVDVTNRTLRMTSEAYEEDPLRVLRGMQFAGRFGLTADAETLKVSSRMWSHIGEIAAERVWVEWEKWAEKSVKPSAGLRFLQGCGALHESLDNLIGCEQDPIWHPEGDVWEHTLQVVDKAAEIADREGLSKLERKILVFAALCHDLGKPATKILKEGRIRNPGHQNFLPPSEAFLASVSMPAELVKAVLALVPEHFVHLGEVNQNVVRRLANRLESGKVSVWLLTLLIEADHTGRGPVARERSPKLDLLVEFSKQLDLMKNAPKPLLLGRHLIEFGMKPGLEFKAILASAFEAQLNGEFTDLESARKWLANLTSTTLN
jgi:tRNA nucleotidyltransferase (CCA-adding enzyme)